MIDVGTFWELVEARARQSRDTPMLLDEHEREQSFAAYRDAAERAAGGLVKLGIGPGTRVAYQLPTRLETIVLMGALARLGATQIPLIPIYREREVAFCLAQTGAEHFVTPGTWGGTDFAALAQKASGGLDVVLHHFESALPEDANATLPPPPTDPHAVRWIYYTSGTTSHPKGVKHTDQTVMTVSRGMSGRYHNHAGDILGVAFPFTHVGGLMNLMSILLVGHRMVVMEAFKPAAAVELFARKGVTVIGGGPVFYASILEEQRKQPGTPVLPRFRAFSGGGAPMPSELHYEVKRELGGAGCVHGFGMTECGIVTANDAGDSDERKAQTDGRPGLGVELEVLSFSGERAAPGEEGEVRLRGAAVCKGYVDPDDHAAAFDDEGWFRTGDVGFQDAEGYVTLTGRLKDIIIRKGENISANEIEDVLYRHPKVGDAAVIGLPDRERGELVCAVITAAEGEEPLGFEEMLQHFVDAQLMKQKIPERLERIDEMPRNPTGKILKKDLVQRFTPEGSR